MVEITLLNEVSELNVFVIKMTGKQVLRNVKIRLKKIYWRLTR